MKLTEAQLELIVNSYKSLELACNKASEAGCLDINGNFFDAIWRGFDNMLSIMDQDSWIHWYVNDNDMGEKGLPVTVGRRKYKVKTIKTLLKIINS